MTLKGSINPSTANHGKHKDYQDEQVCLGAKHKMTYKKVKEIFNTFEGFEYAWHSRFRRINKGWKASEMYTNGQFDEFPYIDWEKNISINIADWEPEIDELSTAKL